jgi:hypothetical protein
MFASSAVATLARMLPALTFWSQPQVVTDSWVELAGTITLIAFVVGVYKHLECHRAGCHRLGRFQHGHYKLCRVHHPLVPSDGHVTDEQIAAVTPPSGTAPAHATAAAQAPAPPVAPAGPGAGRT